MSKNPRNSKKCIIRKRYCQNPERMLWEDLVPESVCETKNQSPLPCSSAKNCVQVFACEDPTLHQRLTMWHIHFEDQDRLFVKVVID